MNELEKQLTYPLADRLPELGETLDIAPGVRWLRMRLPFALDHINLWLLRDKIDGREGWTIVDCGIASSETRTAWEQIFAERLEGLPVLRVLVTHMHPDHIGNAHWLTERWSTPEADCRLWISATDYASAHLALNGSFPMGGPVAAAFYYSQGLVNDEAQRAIGERGEYFVSLVPNLPQRYRRLMDGMRLDIGGREWVCHAGYGHAPEHMSFECPELKLLISGDMVLPRISTNVSVGHLEPEANPLRLYLASVDRMRALDPDTLVLPSHGRPFRGLHTRAKQLADHHDERLAAVLEACRDKAASAADMLPVLFRRQLDIHQTTFAMGESVAHLHALWHDGLMERRRDADGVFRFRTIAAASL